MDHIAFVNMDTIDTGLLCACNESATNVRNQTKTNVIMWIFNFVNLTLTQLGTIKRSLGERKQAIQKKTKHETHWLNTKQMSVCISCWIILNLHTHNDTLTNQMQTPNPPHAHP